MSTAFHCHCWLLRFILLCCVLLFLVGFVCSFSDSLHTQYVFTLFLMRAMLIFGHCFYLVCAHTVFVYAYVYSLRLYLYTPTTTQIMCVSDLILIWAPNWSDFNIYTHYVWRSDTKTECVILINAALRMSCFWRRDSNIKPGIYNVYRKYSQNFIDRCVFFVVVVVCLLILLPVVLVTTYYRRRKFIDVNNKKNNNNIIIG